MAEMVTIPKSEYEELLRLAGRTDAVDHDRLEVQIGRLETMSDRQVIAEYRKHIDDLGIPADRISVSTDEDGNRKLRMSVPFADHEELYPHLPGISMQVARAEQRARAQIADSADTRRTVVVNLFGGPGAGKTTAAYDICSRLKALGYDVGYAPEIAKELALTIRDGSRSEEERVSAALELNGSWESQTRLYLRQRDRIDRLIGQCDFAVTDSPALLSCIYLQEGDTFRRKRFEERCLSDFGRNDNFNVFVERGDSYTEHGRVHTKGEALDIDAQLRRFMRDNGVYYRDQRQGDTARTVEMLVQAHGRVSGPDAPSPARSDREPERSPAKAIGAPVADRGLSR